MDGFARTAWMLTLSLALASSALAQWKEDPSRIKNWETEVGALFDKYDRDHDGSWGAREARIGSGALNSVIGGMAAENQRLEQVFMGLPRVSASRGTTRGDASPFPTPFTAPKGPYETESKGGDFGGARSETKLQAPEQGATKDQVVKYYVSLIHRLDAYNRYLTQQIQTRQNSLRSGAAGGRRG